MQLFTVKGLQSEAKRRKAYVGLGPNLAFTGKTTITKAVFMPSMDAAKELEKLVVAQCGWVETSVIRVNTGKFCFYVCEGSNEMPLLFAGDYGRGEGAQLFRSTETFSLFADRTEALRVDNLCRDAGLRTNLKRLFGSDLVKK